MSSPRVDHPPTTKPLVRISLSLALIGLLTFLVFAEIPTLEFLVFSVCGGIGAAIALVRMGRRGDLRDRRLAVLTIIVGCAPIIPVGVILLFFGHAS
jgi:hypothetical protein